MFMSVSVLVRVFIYMLVTVFMSMFMSMFVSMFGGVLKFIYMFMSMFGGVLMLIYMVMSVPVMVFMRMTISVHMLVPVPMHMLVFVLMLMLMLMLMSMFMPVHIRRELLFSVYLYPVMYSGNAGFLYLFRFDHGIRQAGVIHFGKEFLAFIIAQKIKKRGGKHIARSSHSQIKI